MSFSANRLGLNGKQFVRGFGGRMVHKRFKGMGTSWDSAKREAVNKSGWRRSVCSYVGLRRFGDVVTC
jgi:hypothetical protein